MDETDTSIRFGNGCHRADNSGRGIAKNIIATFYFSQNLFSGLVRGLSGLAEG